MTPRSAHAVLSTLALALMVALAAPGAAAQLVDAHMLPGDQFTGEIEASDDIDLVQLETVALSSFKVIVSPLKGSSLLPSVRLIDASDDSVLAEAAATKKKVVLKTPPVPGTGTYWLRVTGTAGTTGGYLLKFTEKLDKSAKKQLLDVDVDGAAELALGFDAAAGFELTATVQKKGSKSEADPAEPELSDPAHAVVELDPDSLKVNKKGNRYTLKRVPLASTGSYELSALNEGGAGAMRARASLRRAKAPKRKLVELPIGETGEPTLTGRVFAGPGAFAAAPLAGVTVSVRSAMPGMEGELPVTTLTDADGLFVIASPPEGAVLVDIDGSTQPGLNVFPVFTVPMSVDGDGPSELPGPAVLTRQSQFNTGFAGNVGVGPGGVTTELMDGVGHDLPEMAFHGPIGTIVREDGQLFSGANVSPRINRVLPGDLTVPLSDGEGLPLDASFYANIEPANLSFDTSGAIEGLPQGLDLSLPNDRGFPPGTLLDIWAWDPTDVAWVNRSTQTGQQGLVSVGGERVEADDVVLEGGLYAAALPVDAPCATTVIGHVQQAVTGAPLAGVHVATSLGVHGVTDVNGDVSLALVPAYERGDLPGCVPVGFELVVTAPASAGSVRAQVTVNAGQVNAVGGDTTDFGTLVLELPDTGIVVAEVIDNGLPVTGQAVALSGPSEAQAVTDDAGRFVLADLVPGSYVGSHQFTGAEDPTEVAFQVGPREVSSIAIQRAGGQGEHDVTVRVVRVPDSPLESPEPLSGVSVVLVGSDPFSSEGLTATTNAQGRASFTSVDPPYDVTATDDQPFGADGTARVTTSVLGIDPGDDSIGVPVSMPRAPVDDTTDALIAGSIANLPEGLLTTYEVQAISADPTFPFRTSAEAFFDGSYELDVPSGHSWHVVLVERVLEFAFPDDIEYVAGALFELGVADPGPDGTAVVDFDLQDPSWLPFDSVVSVSYDGLPASSQLSELSLALTLQGGDPALDGVPLLELFDEVFGDDEYLPPASLRLPDPDHASLAGFRLELGLEVLAAELSLVEAGARLGTCTLPYVDDGLDVEFELLSNPVITNPSNGEVFDTSQLDGLVLGWFDQAPGSARGWVSATLASDDVFLSLGVDHAVWQVIVPLGANQAALPPAGLPALGVGEWSLELVVRVLSGSSFDFDDGFGDAVEVNLPAARLAADAVSTSSIRHDLEIVPE